MADNIQIKGIREGLLISIPDGEWENVQELLLEEIGTQASFLQGGKLILDVENHVLNARAMGKLMESLAEHDVSLWGILSHSPTTERTAQTYGLATRIHQTHPHPENRPIETTQFEGDEGLLVQRTLRSGNSIEFPGHVTLIGDVNPGAEIIAGGNIVVWGKLRGTAHAGAEGDEDAIVCALELSPTQLRIGELISLSPDDKQKKQPEMARIQDGQVVAEPWG